MMQSLNTREINKTAQNIFHNSISPAWLIRGQDPDYHIDYFVEIADKTGPTGTVFGVQLKGTASPKYTTNHIKLTMKTKHIAYYLDKVKQPIFVIAVDIISNKGYYLFIQDLFKSSINNNWRNQKTIVINIPSDNLLTDAKKFQEVIYYSENYMRDLWPSSIPVAINYEKKRLENLDPRFKVSISHYNGKTRYGLSPKENVDIKCQFKYNKNIKKGIIDYYNRGLPFSIKQTDILKIEGSKIIEEAFKKSSQGQIIIGPSKKAESLLVFSILNDFNQEISTIYINGIIFGGRKEFRIQGKLNESPFKVNILGKWKKKRLKLLDFEFNFEFKKWERLSILKLPFFDKIFSLLIAIKNGNAIKMVCEIKGMKIIEGISDKFNYENINNIYNYLNLLNKVRIIANTTGIDIILPKLDSITKDDIENIELIYTVIKKGEYRRNGSNTIFKAKIVSFEKIIESLGQDDTEKIWPEPLCIEVQEAKYNIFGKEIDFGPLRYTLTNPKTVINKRSNDLEMLGTKNSEFIVNRLL